MTPTYHSECVNSVIIRKCGLCYCPKLNKTWRCIYWDHWCSCQMSPERNNLNYTPSLRWTTVHNIHNRFGVVVLKIFPSVILMGEWWFQLGLRRGTRQLNNGGSLQMELCGYCGSVADHCPHSPSCRLPPPILAFLTHYFAGGFSNVRVSGEWWFRLRFSV